MGLLIRRLKERANKSALQCIGTSATMASGDSAEARRQAVADFAGNLFGSTISADNVIEETLERLITRARPLTRGGSRMPCIRRYPIKTGLPLLPTHYPSGSKRRLAYGWIPLGTSVARPR